MGDRFEWKVETARFRNWTGRLQRDINGNLGRKVLRAVGLEAARRLIQKTPVDTGRARGGWTAIFDITGNPVSLGGQAGGAEGRAQSSVREHYTGEEQFIELINGVAYVVSLEFGHSQQAPHGMIRVTLREIQNESLMARTLLSEFVKSVQRTNRG